MLALPARGFLGLVKLATIVTDFAIYYLARLLDYMLVDPLKVVLGWTTKKALPVSGEPSDTTFAASIGAFRRLVNQGLKVLEAIAPQFLSVRVEQIFRWTEAGFAALGSVYLKNKQYLHDIAVGDSTSARLLCVAMGYFDAFCTISFVSALGEPVLGRFGKAVAEASASHGTVIKVRRSTRAVHAVVLTILIFESLDSSCLSNLQRSLCRWVTSLTYAHYPSFLLGPCTRGSSFSRYTPC